MKANHIKPVQTYMPIKLKRAKQEHYAGGSMNLSRPRIAICWSGQLRTGKRANLI